MVKYIAIVFIFVLSVPSFSYGIERIYVLDQDMSPIIGATASLIDVQDSTVLDAQISNTLGIVDFQYKRCGNLSLLVRCIGYEHYETTYNKCSDTIFLRNSATMLPVVTVTSQTNALKRKSDRFIYDPSALKKEVATSYDLLRLTPLLISDGSSFSILGKGKSKIFINGRDPKMEANALLEMLRALPAEQIKKIEIITSPGSSQSASISGGIINLVLDNLSHGLIGSVSSETKYQNERVSPFISIWSGYTHNRFDFSFNAAYFGDNTNEALSNSYYYSDLNRSVHNNIRNSGWQNQLSSRINASYKVSSKSMIGMAVNINGSQSSGKSIINSATKSPNGNVFSNSQINNIRPWKRPNIGTQAYYTLKTDDKGSNFDISADYTTNVSSDLTEYLWTSSPEHQSTKVFSRGFHLKPMFQFVKNDGHRFDAGYELFGSHIDNTYSATSNSNRFLYKEIINSYFASWEASWSSFLTTTAGVRIEHANVNVHQYKTNDRFRHSHSDIFPSFSCSMDLPGHGNQNVSIDIERRISRPYYSSLNPFVFKTSETTLKKGNTDLHPSYEWDFSIYYSLFNDFILGANYGLSSNTLLDYTYEEGNNTVSSTRNFGNSNSFSGFISFNHVYGGFWRVKASGSIYFDKYDASLNDVDLAVRSCNYSIDLQNSIVLSKNKSLRLMIHYALYSPVKTITDKGKYKNLLSMSITKMFGSGLTLSLDGFNILGFKNDAHFISNHYSFCERSLIYPAEIMIKCNYVFGNRRVTGASDRYNSALDNRFKQ